MTLFERPQEGKKAQHNIKLTHHAHRAERLCTL